MKVTLGMRLDAAVAAASPERLEALVLGLPVPERHIELTERSSVTARASVLLARACSGDPDGISAAQRAGGLLLRENDPELRAIRCGLEAAVLVGELRGGFRPPHRGAFTDAGLAVYAYVAQAAAWQRGEDGRAAVEAGRAEGRRQLAAFFGLS